jgi:hypothetical protein
MGHRRHDDAMSFGQGHRSVGSKFVFLVLLALGHTVMLGLTPTSTSDVGENEGRNRMREPRQAEPMPAYGYILSLLIESGRKVYKPKL